MDKRGQIHNSQSSSICNRLFNFIINTIWVTMGNQIPIESPKDIKNMNGAIEIEFRHMEIVGPKKIASIKEITQKRNEAKQIPSAPTLTPTSTSPARRRHFINVASNINEKTEAFIKSKKEALRKSYNNDPVKKT
ncbi:hypothetical protein AABB24_016047 [Solanum stoloniferum]|uniref:Uncharacterized protein n=2 Tax=Solanum TaxID=4107 RepID=A0AAF0ZPT5_SOLVR|nr:hypothetical protein MTR67_040892 [Solanum verrucosum]